MRGCIVHSQGLPLWINSTFFTLSKKKVVHLLLIGTIIGTPADLHTGSWLIVSEVESEVKSTQASAALFD